MKVVINNCFGGFSLSPKGCKRYLELTGHPSYFYKQTKYFYRDGKDEFTRIDNIDDVPSIFFYCTVIDQGAVIADYPKNIFNSYDLERSDPILVQVVNELGNDASGECAALKVVNIKSGRWFKIDEYDGLESIQYRDIDDEWILAK